MSVLALVLMGLLVASIADADDEFALLSPPRHISVEAGNAAAAMEDDDSGTHDVCFCPICMDALEEYYAPTFGPPEAWAWFDCVSLNPVSSLYLPEIFRPPIS